MMTSQLQEAESNLNTEEETSCCQDLREEFRLDKLKLEYPVPRHFISPQCFRSSVYIVWTGVWAMYHVAMLSLEVYYNRDLGGKFMIYLTNWSYIIVSAFSISDFVITVYIHMKRMDIIEQSETSLSTTWYMKMQWILFNIINTTSLLVTLLYYALLDVVMTHSSINKHLLNSVYALSSLLFCAKPVRLLHVYQPFVYALIYLIFSVVYHVGGGGAVYSALDWNQTGSAVLMAFLVLALGVPVVHTFCFALYTFRIFLYARCCIQPLNNKRCSKKHIQREITPRDVELVEASRSRPQTRTSNSRPGTNRPESNRHDSNGPRTLRSQTRMSVLPV